MLYANYPDKVIYTKHFKRDRYVKYVFSVLEGYALLNYTIFIASIFINTLL